MQQKIESSGHYSAIYQPNLMKIWVWRLHLMGFKAFQFIFRKKRQNWRHGAAEIAKKCSRRKVNSSFVFWPKVLQIGMHTGKCQFCLRLNFKSIGQSMFKSYTFKCVSTLLTDPVHCSCMTWVENHVGKNICGHILLSLCPLFSFMMCTVNGWKWQGRFFIPDSLSRVITTEFVATIALFRVWVSQAGLGFLGGHCCQITSVLVRRATLSGEVNS